MMEFVEVKHTEFEHGIRGDTLVEAMAVLQGIILEGDDPDMTQEAWDITKLLLREIVDRSRMMIEKSSSS